ncbi:MAG: hypothetical protein JNJ58_04220 [Chitinophagaceae bacterium]|nr:hypothetical protein [Chitinophagaceae bacterium]
MQKTLSMMLILFLSAWTSTLSAQSPDMQPLTTRLGEPTLEEIVTRHIDAIGGKANWSKIKTIKTEGTMKAQGAEIKITIYQKDKVAMRQDIAVMGMNGWFILTKTEGWNFMPFQGQTKPEPMTADDVKQAQDGLNIQDDFITYKEQGKKLELVGKDDVDGVECLKLKMKDAEGKETTYYLDPESYLIIKETEKIKANGQEVDNTTTYGNYKKLDEGIVMPMSIIQGYGETEITLYEINKPIDENLFKPSKS